MSAFETLLAAAQFVEMQDSLKSAGHQFQPQLYSSNNNNNSITTDNTPTNTITNSIKNNTQLLPINGLLSSPTTTVSLITTPKSSPTSLSPSVITNQTNTIPIILEPSTILIGITDGEISAAATTTTTTTLANVPMKLTPSKLNIPHVNGTRYQSFQPQHPQPQQKSQPEILIKANSNVIDDKIHRRRYKSSSEYVIGRNEELQNSTNVTHQNRNYQLIPPPVLPLLSTSSPTPIPTTSLLSLHNNSLSPTFETSRSRSSSFSAINNINLLHQPKQQHLLRHNNVPNGETTKHCLNLSVSSKNSGYLSGSGPNIIISGNPVTVNGNGNHFKQNNSLSISPINNSSSSSNTANDNPNINAININGININATQQQHNNINNQIQPPSRRRTVSTNSNGAGTREVHNKLEKNRRAHLKECFEALKKQLPQTNEEKKTSNLSILGNACRHILSLKRREREMEHEMERLAKEKISKQQQILNLRRELSIWDQSYMSEFELPTRERFLSETVSEPSMPLTSRIRYASTSSLSSVSSSIAVPPSIAGISVSNHQTTRNVPKSPQVNTAPLNVSFPISLITKNVDSQFYQNSLSSSSSSSSSSPPPPLSSSPLSFSSSVSPSIIASTTMPITSPSSSTGHVVTTPVSSSIKIMPIPNGSIQHPQQIAINFTTTNDVNFTSKSGSSLLSSLTTSSSTAPTLPTLNHTVSTNHVQMPLNLNVKHQSSMGKNIMQMVNTTSNNSNNLCTTTTTTTTATNTPMLSAPQQQKLFTIGCNTNSSMSISSSASSSPFTISDSTLMAKELNSNLLGKNGYHHHYQHGRTKNNEYNNINFNQKLLQLQNDSKNNSNSIQNTLSHSSTPINNVTDILIQKETIKYSDLLPLLASSLSMSSTTTTTISPSSSSSSSSSSSVGAIVEPPTKVIKLINGNIAFPTSVDNKDNHHDDAPTEQLTLPKVVVSPLIPLIGQSQSLRVIGQTNNGLPTTIELTNSNCTGQQRNNNQHQHENNIQTVPATGAQLHKLLLSGSVGNNSNNNNNHNHTNINNLLRKKQSSITTAVEFTRLPGGAELNSLPSYGGIKGLNRGSNNGISPKGTIDTIRNRTPVHVVTTMPSNETPITILSHGRLITSSSPSPSPSSSSSLQQLAGKVVTSIGGQQNTILPITTIIGTQYLNTTIAGKPLMLTVSAGGGFTSPSTINNNNLLNAKTTNCGGISLTNEISSSNVLPSLVSSSSSSSSSSSFSATTTTTLSSTVSLSQSILTSSLPIAIATVIN